LPPKRKREFLDDVNLVVPCAEPVDRISPYVPVVNLGRPSFPVATKIDPVEAMQIVDPDHSYAALDEMTGQAETILQKLGLLYRATLWCTGDMDFGGRRMHDLEVW
jgi:hypothetical protein